MDTTDVWDENWQSDSWEREQQEIVEESTNKIISSEESSNKRLSSSEQQTDVEFNVHMKEVLDSLNEKTEECEYLQKELDVKKGELQERETLVQQVFAELKGLELQLNENRNHGEVMNNMLNEKNAEFDKLKLDYANLQQKFATIVQSDGKESEQLRQDVQQLKDDYGNRAAKAEERETMLSNRLKEAEEQLMVQRESFKNERLGY